MKTTLTRVLPTTRILASSIAALLAVQAAHASSATWSGLSGTAWSSVGNWTSDPNPVPGSGLGETATFSNDGNTNIALTLGGGVTIRSIVFNNVVTIASYTIGTGAETLTIEGTGGIAMNSNVGVVETIGANVALGAAAGAEAFTVTNNSLGASLDFAGGISGGAAGLKTVTFTGAGATSVAGVIADGTGSVALSKTGTGTLTLSNSNTYTGQTTVTQGTLSVGATNALGTGAPVLVNGGTLALANNFVTVGAVTLSSGSITGTGVELLTGTSYAVQSGTISARLAGFGVTLTKTTSGTVTLSGANTFTGQMSVQNGTVSIATINNASSSGVLGNSALAVILGNTGAQTGTLRYTGGSTSSTKKFTMATGGTGAFQIDTAGAILELTGLIDGSGALSKTGAGTLKISGANTSFTGPTTVSAGSLILGNQNGFGTGTVTLAGGTNFKTSGFEGNSAGGALPNAFVLSGGKVTLDVAFGGANDMWINTSVSGAGGFVVTGSGRDQGLTLSGAKTFSGGVTLGTVGSAGDTPNVSIDDNASLGVGILRSELSSSSVTAGALRINTSLSNVANQIVMASGARIVIRTLGNNVTLNGVISDEGSGGNFLTADSGTVTLGNANTFKGTTTIASGGTVALANALGLQNSTLSYSTGTLSFGTLTAATLGGLSGSQGIALTNASTQAMALTVGNNSTSTTYSSTFTDGAAAGGSVTKTGTGTLTLSNNAALSQTGATTINGGTLLMTGAAPNVPTSAVTANSGGTLAVNIASPLTLNNTLTFTGTGSYRVQVDGGGTAVTQVNGNLDVTGTPVLKLAAGGSAPTAGTYTILNYTGTLLNSAAWSVDASLLNSSGSQLSNWTDGNSTWDTAANWDQQGWGGTVVYDNPNSRLRLSGLAIGNIAPIFSTLATIAPANPAAVTGPAAAATVASLTVGNGGANAHSLTLQASAPLTVTGPVTVNGNGTITASAAALSAGTLNMSGGSVTVGAGSSAGTVNLTSGTLAATVGGNELTVSTKLVKTTASTVTISAGTSPFKVGGSNLVSSINKLVVQGGTTSISNPTTITLTDVGTQWSGTSATLVSNPFTVSPGANVLVVTVNQRTLSPPGSAYNASTHPTVTYDGVAMTLDTAAGGPYGYGQINGFTNSQVFYMLNAPTGAANNLDVSFPYAGTDYVVNAFTLAGVSTTVPVRTNGYVQETTNTPSNIGISLTGVTAGSAVVSAYMQRLNNPVSTTTSSGTLDTSGTGGGSGDFWSNLGPNTASAGALALGVNSGTVTITHSSSSAAREIFAAAAFAPASSAVTLSSTAVAVTSSNTLDFGGAPSVSLGALTMEAGSSLTMTNAPSAGVSFSNIVANGTSQIAAGAPISIRNGGSTISVATGQTLTVGTNILRSTSTDQLQKVGAGVLKVTGNIFSASDPSALGRRIGLTAGSMNLVNANVYATYFFTGDGGVNTNFRGTNTNINIDGEVNEGTLIVGYNSNRNSTFDLSGGSLTTIWGGIQMAPSGGGVKSIITLDNTIVQLKPSAGNPNDFSALSMGDGGSGGSTHFVMKNGSSLDLYSAGYIRVGTSEQFNVLDQLSGTVNVPRNTSTPFNGTPGALTLQYRMNRASCYGIYNLGGSATLTTGAIVSGDGTPNFTQNNAYFNFHGGTLKPAGNDSNFIRTTITGANAALGGPQVFIYSEGAVIDTDGKNIAIGVPLRVPAGNGVFEGTIPLAPADQGSGYKATPMIYVTTNASLSASSGSANGATAIANMVDDGTGNGTLKIASVTITNPGQNFGTAPVLAFPASPANDPGDPTTAAVLPTLTIAANVSGGLTKNGVGTLTLGAANTYRGNTLVNTGTLALGNVNAVQFSTLDTGTAGAQDVTFTVAGTNTYNLGGLQGADDLNAGSNSLSIGANNANTTSTANITAASVTKVGTGTQDLDGANLNFDILTVNDGTLNVNGTLTTATAAVTVADTPGGAATTLRFGTVSQTLSSLTIGAGATVIFTSGTPSGTFTKVGTGTQDLNGPNLNYDTVMVLDGTLNVNGTLTTPAAVTVTDTAGGAPTKLRFGTVSQTLSSLTIGAGTTVIFTSGTASGSLGGGGSGGKASSFGGVAAVPEPGTLGLLLVGALGVLHRRRRQG